MASGSFNLTRTGSTSSYINFTVYWSSSSNGSTANSSTVNVDVKATKSSSSTSATWGTHSTTATVGGTSQSASGSFTLNAGATVLLLRKSYTVPHNSDGTKSVLIDVNVGGNVMWGSGAKTVALDTIPQYATVSQSLSSKTETSISMRWSSDSTIDYIWYSKDNGSNWTGVDVADGKSGTYTIGGLTANTTYKIKTRVRRKDSQRTTDSSALNVTTYNYPYCNSMPSFTIGSRITLGFYNPLSRNIHVNILGADGSEISFDNTTGTSISGYNGTAVCNNLYASIPNAKSATYRVRVTYGNVVMTNTGGTYTVNENVCKPSISSANYQDSNPITTALTSDNQLIIRNQSLVQFTATLAPQNHATSESCQLEINGNTYAMTLNGNSATVDNIKIDSAMDTNAVLTMTDSRGLTVSREVEVTMLDWVLPSAVISLARQNNFYSETDINVDANYSSIDLKNTIQIQVRCKKVDDTEWDEYEDLEDKITSVLVLDNNYAWDVQIVLTDQFGSTTYNLYVSRGMPLIYFDRLKSSVGVNCFPSAEKSLEVEGINVRRSVMSRTLTTTIANSAVNSYTKIPLTSVSSTSDSRLTATESGGIRIGAGVSKVLVSGRMSMYVRTSGTKYLKLAKNDGSNDAPSGNTLAWVYEDFHISNYSNEIMYITPMIVDVVEGDEISLWYYTSASNDDISGNSNGGRTSLTVETVE